MNTRSFVRSCGLLVLGGFVLLGAGCGRGTASADPSAVTPPSAGAPSGSPAEEGGTAVETPSGAAPLARGACDHPYYPLRVGYEVRYRSTFPSIGGVSSGGYSLRVTEATATTAKLAATFDSSAPDQAPIVSEQVFTCGNGSVTANSYLDLGSRIPGGAGENQFRAATRSATGEMLPADIRLGSSWRNGFDIRMESVAPGGLLSQPIDLTVSIERRVVARERVRVPAGEYDALKVTAMTDLGMGSTMQGTEWWVEGVGMVKSTYDLGAGTESTVTEAVSVTVPR